MIGKQLTFNAIGLIFLFSSNVLLAEEKNDSIPEMSQEKLERIVIRQFNYIDQRLLKGTSAQKIIESRNAEAIKILELARKSKDEIAKQISDEEYRDAFLALRKLNTSIKKAIKISRAKDKAIKKIKDDMESAHIINETYFARAKKWGIDKGDAGEEALALIKQAIERRARAEQDFKAASDGFHESTELLKKAVTAARKWNIANTEELKEIEE